MKQQKLFLKNPVCSAFLGELWALVNAEAEHAEHVYMNNPNGHPQQWLEAK